MIERFLKYVEKTNYCWNWIGATSKKGYGQFAVNRKTTLAHRVAHKLWKEDPNKLQVLHTCDNPKCVNPDHLWLGTNKDNVNDRVNKNRSNRPRGAKSGMAKYTQETVTLIRAHTGPLSAIVREFGISKSQASKIRSGECW